MDDANETSPLLNLNKAWRTKLKQRIFISGGITLICFVVVATVLIVRDTKIPSGGFSVAERASIVSNGRNNDNRFEDTWKRAETVVQLKNTASFTDEKETEERDRVCPFQRVQKYMTSGYSEEKMNCALTAEEVRRMLNKCIDISFLPAQCKPWSTWRKSCVSNYKYRKFDGTCNNEVHPTWGKSETPYVRMIPPDYADGISEIRKSKSGRQLPNARFLSAMLYSNRLRPDVELSDLFASFGLFTAHDMIQTALHTNKSPCCSDRYVQYPQSRPRECLQIEIPSNDTFYGPRNVRCLNYHRSVPVHGECIGRREQLNTATAFLDGSVIYGSLIQQAKRLRSFKRGKLRVQYIEGKPFMPNSDKQGFVCGTSIKAMKCFDAGQLRENMIFGLTGMHLLWHREHNRIADELQALNPRWTDEILFQETRRILIAELQHITFKEFLPLILGEDGMDEFGLRVDENHAYDGYDNTIDPAIFNVFASAAYKFGHSLIQDSIQLIANDNTTELMLPLHEALFNVQPFHEQKLDSVIRGAATQQAHDVDSYATNEMRNRLFQDGNDYGYDIISMDILRGRDHGIPAYPVWRKACGLFRLKSWNEIYGIMDPERVDILKTVYESLEDIDLMPAAVAETRIRGSLLGPTLRCIVGRQFKKTRTSDRFWFEVRGQSGSFSPDQMNQIYKSSMARIICDNSDNIDEIQLSPFKIPSKTNSIVKCSEIPSLDLSPWNVGN